MLLVARPFRMLCYARDSCPWHRTSDQRTVAARSVGDWYRQGAAVLIWHPIFTPGGEPKPDLHMIGVLPRRATVTAFVGT